MTAELFLEYHGISRWTRLAMAGTAACLLAIIGAFAHTSTARAVSWSSPMKIAGGRADTPNDSFAIALPQGGTMFAGSSGAGIEIARTSNGGAVLASGFALDPNSGQRIPSAAALDLAVDGTGRVVMAAWGSDGLWLTRFAPGAVQPQTRTQITPSFSFRGPVSIALDSNGRGVLAWTQPEVDRPDAPRQLWLSRLAPDGATTTPVRLQGADDLSASMPQVVTATNGVSCILWTQPDQDGAEQVAWTTVSPTGVVGPIRTIPNSADPVEFARDTQLVAGAGGSFLAVAMYVRGQNDRVNALRLMRIASDGSMRSSEDIVETPLTPSDRIDAPVLASNKHGEALVAWGRWRSTSGDCPTDDIHVSRISSDGIVSGPTVIASDIPLHCSIVPPSVALADDGTGAVGWIQGAQSSAFVDVLPPTGGQGKPDPLPTLSADSAADVPFLAFTGPRTLSTLWSNSSAGGGSNPTWQVVSVADPSVSPRPPEISCPDVQVVAVRGSRASPTDPSPLDEPFVPERVTDPAIAHFVTHLRDRLEARFGTAVSVATAWIRYDAASAVRALASFVDWGRTFDYNRSVDDGVSRLKARLPEYQDKNGCLGAGTQLVLAGFSQGAHVVGRAMDEGMPLQGVKAVVLMGDPTFSVEHSGDVTYLPSFGINPIGALGARDHDFPQGPKVFSICRPRDAVCDGLGGTIATNSIPPVFYPEHGKYRDPYTVGSGPWWSYTERTFPAPTHQMADKVARQAISESTVEVRQSVPFGGDSSVGTGFGSGRSVAADPQSTTPVVVLPQRIVTRPREPVLISASLSYDSSGSPLRYEWDLDGDGTFERSTTERPWLEIAFATPRSSTLAVRATNDQGTQTIATCTLDVSPDAPGRPSAPRDPEAVPGDHAVTLHWHAPSDTGGLPITTYLIRDATTGGFVAQLGDTTQVTLDGRDAGAPVAFTITARNSARVGIPSTPTATVVPLESSPSFAPTQQVPAGPGPPLMPPGLVPGGWPTPLHTPFRVGLSVGMLRTGKLSRGRQLVVNCSLNAAGSCDVRATLSTGDARRLGLSRKNSNTGAVRVGMGRVTLRKPGRAAVRLTLLSAFRRAAGRARRSFRLRFDVKAMSHTGAPASIERLVRVRPSNASRRLVVKRRRRY